MATTTFLGGSDVTQYVQEGSVTEKLNEPWQASVRLPTLGTTAGIGSVLDVFVDGAHRFRGEVEYAEYEGDERRKDVVFTGIDPTFINKDRIAADADGDYTKPTFIETQVTGPAIMNHIISNSAVQFGALGYSVGFVAGGGISLVGAPTNWPMYIDEVQNLLTSTGELDCIYEPASNTLNFYNGDYGSDLSGSVRFEYGTGSYNARRCRVTIDRREMKNRGRYLLGPRKSTRDDPKAAQHWWGSIDLTTDGSGGGDPVPNIAALNAAASASQAAHRVRFGLWIKDARDDEATVGRKLYLAHFGAEMSMRLQPKLMFHITPNRGIAPTFRCGDRIWVAGFGLSGVQRVMSMTYRWTADGPIELGEPVGQAGPKAISTTAVAESL